MARSEQNDATGDVGESGAFAIGFASKMFYVEEAIRALLALRAGGGQRKANFSRLIAIMVAGSLSSRDINLHSGELAEFREIAENESTC